MNELVTQQLVDGNFWLGYYKEHVFLRSTLGLSEILLLINMEINIAKLINSTELIDGL